MNVIARGLAVLVLALLLTSAEAVRADAPAPRDYGLIVFVSRQSQSTPAVLANYIGSQCYILRDLFLAGLAQPSVSKEALLGENGLAPGIRSLAQSTATGTRYSGTFFDPELKKVRDCTFSTAWVVVPESLVALGPISIASGTPNNPGAVSVPADGELRLSFSSELGSGFQAAPSGVRLPVATEQLSLLVADRVEGVAAHVGRLPLYPTIAYYNVAPTTRALPETLKFIAATLPVESTLRDEGTQILDRSGGQSAYAQLFYNILLRKPDGSGRSLVDVPSTALRFVVADGQARDKTSAQQQIWVSAGQATIRLSDARLLSVPMPQGCTLVPSTLDAVVVDGARGIAYVRQGVDAGTSLSAVPPSNAGDRKCRFKVAVDGVSVTAVDSVDIASLRSADGKTHVPSGMCLWDTSCRAWFSVSARNSCEVYASCTLDATMAARLSLGAGTSCAVESGTQPERWQCPATTLDDCRQALLGTSWSLVRDVRKEYSLPLCQAQP